MFFNTLKSSHHFLFDIYHSWLYDYLETTTNLSLVVSEVKTSIRIYTE